MKNIGTKLALVAVLLLFFAWMIYPPQERIRLGKDLRGGVSLIYQLDIPPGEDRDHIISQVIRVLMDRINPAGVLDISIQRVGLERIEVIMPLPTDEVRQLRERLDDLYDEIITVSAINERELDAALAANEAVPRFGGESGTARYILISDLQGLYNDLIAFEEEYEIAQVRRLRMLIGELSEEIRGIVEIDQEALDAALADREAVDRFAGPPDTELYEKVVELQRYYDELTTLEREHGEVADDPEFTIAEFNRIERALATTELQFGEQKAVVLAAVLSRNRLREMLTLSDERRPVADEDGRRKRDPQTGREILEPSPRQVERDLIVDEFPMVANRIDDLIRVYDEYTDKRVGLDDPEDLMRLLRGAGVLEFHIAVSAERPEDVNVQLLREQLAERGPGNIESHVANWFKVNDLSQWYRTPEDLEFLHRDPVAYFAQRDLVAEEYNGEYYLLLYITERKSLRHDQRRRWSITQAYQSFDDMRRDAVAFNLDGPGGQMMAGLTGPHTGQPMAIVLDGEVYSAPTLQGQIGSRGQITGDFSPAQLDYLIRVLAAGSLEATLSEDPVAINTIGPSIGHENLVRGLQACLYAVIAVAIFMMLYYFFAGLVADFALFANGIIIFGFMAMIDGTFTLPGLAGIVLTIGMCVDANVLIYERIREELFAGEDLRSAVRLGYKKALSTIIDANVTNLIVCFVLGQTATAEVRGFAVTLAIGICATLFTSLFVTRLIYTLYTDWLKLKQLPMLPTVFPVIHRTLEPSINWMRLRYGFWIFSISAAVISVVLVSQRGVEFFDTEFRGGATLTMTSRVDDETGERSWLPHLGDDGIQQRVRSIGEQALQEPLPAEVPERDRALALRELARASVLTTGRTTVRDGSVLAQSFQIKVATPADIVDEAMLPRVLAEALAHELSDVLDATEPLAFRGVGSDDFAPYTFPISAPTLGANIVRPGERTDVSRYVGGVAVVLEDITPPTTAEDIATRIQRLRNQPDWEQFSGRITRVIGLTPVDPDNLDAGYSEAVVVVRDPATTYGIVDSDVFDRVVTATEWRLINEALQQPPSFEQVSTFSSAVAAAQRAAAVVAVVLSLLGILVYIWVRFGSLRYSLAAIVALVHDVTLALGVLALSQLIAGTPIASFLLIEDFRVEMGVIAAMLTIIGYSLNDTIVILDRIRENRGKLPLATLEQVNLSINQTVSRTVLTSFTTIMAVFIMYTIGGPGIRSFAFVLLAGLLIGTYSSVAIAAPLVFKGTDKDRKREKMPMPIDEGIKG